MFRLHALCEMRVKPRWDMDSPARGRHLEVVTVEKLLHLTTGAFAQIAQLHRRLWVFAIRHRRLPRRPVKTGPGWEMGEALQVCGREHKGAGEVGWKGRAGARPPRAPTPSFYPRRALGVRGQGGRPGDARLGAFFWLHPLVWSLSEKPKPRKSGCLRC